MTVNGALPEEFEGTREDGALSTRVSTSSASEEVGALPATRRVRRHIFRSTLTNSTQVCRETGKKIGMRVKHVICTQCRKRYHTASAPTDRADCLPPAFGTPGATKRTVPPVSKNLAAATMHTSTSRKVPGERNLRLISHHARDALRVAKECSPRYAHARYHQPAPPLPTTGLVEDLIAIINSRGIVEGIYRVPGDKRGVAQLIDRCGIMQPLRYSVAHRFVLSATDSARNSPSLQESAP